MRREPIPADRSINLALAEHAGAKWGFARPLSVSLFPCRGRMLHEQTGHLLFQSYGKRDRECIFSVPRGHLNIALLDAAEATGNVSIHFRHKIEDLDFEQGLADFITEHAGAREQVAIGIPLPNLRRWLVPYMGAAHPSGARNAPAHLRRAIRVRVAPQIGYLSYARRPQDRRPHAARGCPKNA